MRWTANKKAVFVRAIEHGALTKEQVIKDYCISAEELDIWINKLTSYGVEGLKTTKTQRFPI